MAQLDCSVNMLVVKANGGNTAAKPITRALEY